jgi:hypothetical protein
LTLIASFAACYVISSSWTLFPIIGATGRFITVASILAPLIGIFLGPLLGIAAVALGGAISLFYGSYSITSLAAGIASAFCSGILYRQRRGICIVSYISLLLAFAFYPSYGPAWSFPFYVWLHVVGLVVLVSPLLPMTVNTISETEKPIRNSNFGIPIVVFISILYGHLAGSLMYVTVHFPLFVPLKEALPFSWAGLALIYPVERFIMWVSATIIGVALNTALKRLGFL